MAVDAVALKLPTFWTSQPETWFTQAEAQFNLRGITEDSTKYYYVVAALDQETASRLMDLISKPPETEKYTKLKDRLVNTFGLNETERASRLLHFRPLGDSKPSALMDEMIALLGDHPPCLLFRQLFLERLSEDIRIHLVDAKIADFRELARRADALWSSRDAPGPYANTIQRKPAARHKEPKGKSPIPTPGKTLCYYHQRFGEEAYQCRQPCTWSENDKAGRQ